VTLVARAALDLSCEATEGALLARLRELRAALERSGVPIAMGREFDPQRRARSELRDDLARTRELVHLEGELLAGEEDEEILRLGLWRLVQRRALAAAGGRVRAGPHPHAREILSYYARSLAVLEQPAIRALQASAH